MKRRRPMSPLPPTRQALCIFRWTSLCISASDSYRPRCRVRVWAWDIGLSIILKPNVAHTCMPAMKPIVGYISSQCSETFHQSVSLSQARFSVSNLKPYWGLSRTSIPGSGPILTLEVPCIDSFCSPVCTSVAEETPTAAETS